MSDELVQLLLDGWDEADQTRVVQILAAASTPDIPTPGRGPREQRQEKRPRSRAGRPGAAAVTDAS